MSGTNPLPAGQWVNIPQLGSGSLAGGGVAGGFNGQGASNARPLRGPPVAFVRQPYLGSPPAVSAISGFGTGSGAMIRNNGSDADQSQGLVAVKVGLNPATAAEITLHFPVEPADSQYWFGSDWASAEATYDGNDVSLALTLGRRLVPGEWLLLAYQWAVSH